MKNTLKIVKIFALLNSAVYILVWLSRFVSIRLFNFLNKFFHFLPNAFDRFALITINIGGKSVPLGYLYIALIFFIVAFCVWFYERLQVKDDNDDIDDDYTYKPVRKNNYENRNIQLNTELSKTIIEKKVDVLAKKELPENQEEIKPELKREINLKPPKKVIKETKKEINPIPAKKNPQIIKSNDDITEFYGLLTFEIKHSDDSEIEQEAQKLLKHEYSEIIVEKLKQKYEQVKYAASDKVFFICDNVSLFNLFVRDIVQLNKILAQLSALQNIKTALKVCFWSAPNANPKKACPILLKINQLNYLNKIIVSRHIKLKFDNQLIKCFDFCPLGEVVLPKASANEPDIKYELYYLKTMDA